MSDSFDKTQDEQSHIRNFAIIAHIDHGKSTLADRMMEMTGTVQKREMQEQLLDSNPIERERGITIKLAPVRMVFLCHPGPRAGIQGERQWIPGHTFASLSARARNDIKEEYILNLIDTPGHVDFSYEVSRSLAACEGAILLVDATQGVQAQTLSNLAKAREQKLTIIPVINKIDMPNARIKEAVQELRALEFREEEILKISAKTGEGVDELLAAIVDRIPEPQGKPDKPTRALIFSSQYDSHKGVVVFVRVVDGFIRGALARLQGHPLQIRFLASGAEVTPIEVGYFTPKMIACDPPAGGLQTGEVGYIATGLKDARMAKVGDTITLCQSVKASKRQSFQDVDTLTPDTLTPQVVPLPGYKDPQPMVFLGLFPVSADDLTASREAMERLRLSDAAFTFKPIHSVALGNGFHCGFLGLLHAEIVQERLLREFGLSMIATAPSVEYRIKTRLSVLSSRFSDKRSSVVGQSVSDQQKTGKQISDNRQQKTDNWISIQSAAEFPDPSTIEETREPVMQVTIFTPSRFVGAVMQLAQEKRGELVDHKYRGDQAELTYLIPLSDLIIDFFDRLKSITEGYASLDYEFFEYQPVKIVKVDILVNKEKVDALSFLVVEDAAQRRSREIVERLADAIPRQQFETPVQAAIGGSPRSSSGGAGQIIARADVKAFRKDVTQKLYGGDRTRKDKLLDKQKKGKAKMKMIGRVAIPQEAFFTVLRNS
ncbi:GTP-binding protein [Candidatus Gottesmanbacteria bacterium]|nr:GTP-binding protein [Candidatus Gottesmanbacteria bacterium]